MNEDDKYIWNWYLAGRDLSVLASKMNMSEEDIRKRVNSLRASQVAQRKNGSAHLIAAFENTCLQYNMVGEGLKHLGANLSDPVTVNELQGIIDNTPKQMLSQRLLERFIVLRPYTPTDVEELEKDHLNSQSGN